MADSNATPGMVPCRPNCQCSDCQIDRLRARLAEAERLLREAAHPGVLHFDLGVRIDRFLGRTADNARAFRVGDAVRLKSGTRITGWHIESEPADGMSLYVLQHETGVGICVFAEDMEHATENGTES